MKNENGHEFYTGFEDSGLGGLDRSFFEGGEGDRSSQSPSEFTGFRSEGKAHAPPPVSEASTRSNLSIALNTELRAIAASNPKFEAFPAHRIFETANFLVANGITTVEAFRATDEIARRYLLEDLRKIDKPNFLQLAFLFKLARHIPPHDQKVSEKNTR